MRITKVTNQSRDTRWNDWYAWYPVPVAGAWVWLETVERRKEYYTKFSMIWGFIDASRWLYRDR